ncbi:MAG: hypothetical protein ACREOZ_04625, partial [Gloeomargaritales cyanobacterium]
TESGSKTTDIETEETTNHTTNLNVMEMDIDSHQVHTETSSNKSTREISTAKEADASKDKVDSQLLATWNNEGNDYDFSNIIATNFKNNDIFKVAQHDPYFINSILAPIRHKHIKEHIDANCRRSTGKLSRLDHINIKHRTTKAVLDAINERDIMTIDRQGKRGAVLVTRGHNGQRVKPRRDQGL